MESQENMNHLVIPDSHGEYDKVCRIIDAYQDTVDRFVFLGDVVDGAEAKPLISLVRSLGEKAITVVGNHEWVLRNALQEEPDELVEYWRDRLWSRYERDMLINYGVQRSRNWECNAKALREVMLANGHLGWLNSLPAFYETSSFVIVHAGPQHDTPWHVQRKELEESSSTEQRMESEPAQLFSHNLASVKDLPSEVDDRIFITGHSHLSTGLDSRRAAGRICLGSKTRAGEPMFTWESASDEIKAHMPGKR